MSDNDPSLREDLEASLAELNSGTETQVDTGSSETTEVTTEDQSTEAPAPAAPASGAKRDASGKFAPKTPATEQIPADQQQGKAQEVAPADPTVLKAPASWKPEEREGWDKMDPRHRAAVLRREQEVNQVLQSTAGARRFAEQMGQVLQPFMGMIQSEGSNPFMAVHTMMTTAHTLRHGHPAQKAQAVAQLIAQFNIPVEQLDSELSKVLSGKPQEDTSTAAIQRLLDEKLQPVQRFMNDLQTRGQQMIAHSAQTELEQFMNDPANEFAQDVAEEMADLLDLAAQRGQVLSLQDAYRRATMAHPSISSVITSRSVNGAAAQRSAAAAKAKTASASLSSNGGAPAALGTQDETDGSVRADLLASVQALSSRTR